MHQLIYVSEAAASLAPDEVFQIIEQSAGNNLKADITGFLVYRGGRFFQLIEGSQQVLEDLVTKLRSDPRHHSLRVLASRPIATRSFPRWRMKRVGDDQDALAQLRRALATEGISEQLPPQVAAFLQDSGQARVSSAAA